jgi:hypothetical protein
MARAAPQPVLAGGIRTAKVNVTERGGSDVGYKKTLCREWQNIFYS